MEAEKSAKKLRTRLGLKGRVNVESIAAQLGLHIDERVFLGSKVREITIDNGIAVEVRLGRRGRRWVIAHGIGHILLHGQHTNHVWLNLRNEPINRFEREAETFTYGLMLDYRQALHKGPGENLDLATYCGIPASKMTPFGGFE